MVEPEREGSGIQTPSVHGQSMDQGQLQMKLSSTQENQNTKECVYFVAKLFIPNFYC